MSTAALPAWEAPGPPDLGAVEAEADDALDGLDEPAEAAGPSRFRVRDAASADWALRKLAKVRARQEEVRSLAARQREAVLAVVARHLAPLDEWEADQAERLGREEAYFEGLLAEWHREVLAEEPRQRTIRLPHGELVARKAPDRFEVDDEEFLAWARQAAPSLVRVREEPDRQALRRYFAGARPGEALADPATGEILGCVRLVPGEVGYKAVTHAG